MSPLDNLTYLWSCPTLSALVQGHRKGNRTQEEDDEQEKRIRRGQIGTGETVLSSRVETAQGCGSEHGSAFFTSSVTLRKSLNLSNLPSRRTHGVRLSRQL